jgi:hypothetical protein
VDNNKIKIILNAKEKLVLPENQRIILDIKELV